jgi:hypothetical protein
MIDIEFKKFVLEAGHWLDENMPNPSLPDEQRWTIGYSTIDRVGLRFTDEQDAVLFLLRWL